MKAAIILPEKIPGLAALESIRPLPLIPLLGRSLLDLRLEELHRTGLREAVLFTTHNRTAIVDHIGAGERWGIRVEVRELPARDEIHACIREARLPVLPFHAKCATDPRGWFQNVTETLERAVELRLGMRELAAGVRVHRSAKIAPSVRLVAPCWIGANVRIAGGVCVAESVVESGSFLDTGANISRSWIGPSTYVGADTDLVESLAWERQLVKWASGSSVQIADAFLLGPAGTRETAAGSTLPARAAGCLGAIWRAIANLPDYFRRTGNEDFNQRTLA